MESYCYFVVRKINHGTCENTYLCILVIFIGKYANFQIQIKNMWNNID
jgi:hypothetical protein